MTPLDDAPPSGAGPEDEEDGAPRRKGLFALGVVAILALLGAWIYTLFIYDPGLLIDELEDRTFPRAAERVCAAAVARLEALPPAQTARNARERAATVADSNEILGAMLDDLEPLVPAGPQVEGRRLTDEEREQRSISNGVKEWLGDWRAYLQDREEYADRLMTDDEARFLESPKSGTNRQISSAIDAFAEVNRMSSCTTPGDVS